MNSQAEVVRQVLVDYLSSQPDRTALNRECMRVIGEALGRPVTRAVVGPVKRELGITHRSGSLGSKPGETFVTYWTLPEERSSLITGADRDIAEHLVATVARADQAEFLETLASAGGRPNQVITALAQLAAEEQAVER
jgi:hypothetical protein